MYSCISKISFCHCRTVGFSLNKEIWSLDEQINYQLLIIIINFYHLHDALFDCVVVLWFLDCNCVKC